jgi:hypothetical protein
MQPTPAILVGVPEFTCPRFGLATRNRHLVPTPGSSLVEKPMRLARSETRGTCGYPLDWDLFCLCMKTHNKAISQDFVLGTGE